jgi:hypothetical protein
MTGAGALDASVTLEDVFAVVGARRVPLAPELAGYLVLEIAEHADPVAGAIDPKSVFIGEEGSVVLVKPRREGQVEGVESSVRSMLARLLEAGGTQTPALAAAAKRKPGPGLQALAQEIEGALIPVNRAAGRRALARLAREVKRVTLGVGRNALPSNSDGVPSTRRASYPSSPSQVSPGSPVSPGGGRDAPPQPMASFSKEEEPTTTRSHIPDELLKKATPAEWGELPTVQFEPPPRPPSPSQADVDRLIDEFNVSGGGEQQHARDLRAMAGLDPTPPPAGGAAEEAAAGPASTNDSDVEALLALGADPASPGSPAPAALAPVTNDRQLPTRPSKLKQSSSPLLKAPVRRERGGMTAWLLVAAGMIAAGGYAVWRLQPLGPATPAAGAASAATPPAPKAPPACNGTLVVTDVPAHAEALLRAGQAPVDVEKMPVGARLEFVVTAEGYAPRRVVVPAGAPWDRGPDGKPRFEAAAQLDRSKARSGTNDPWPAAEPGSEVGGQGPPGTVHVVSTPRGAEVWMLAGIGPEVRIELLRCDQDLDVLIAGPTTFRRRLHVATGDFVRAEGGESNGAAADKASGTKIARVSAK